MRSTMTTCALLLLAINCVIAEQKQPKIEEPDYEKTARDPPEAIRLPLAWGRFKEVSSEQFGLFPEALSSCGSHLGVKTPNPGYTGQTFDIEVPCFPFPRRVFTGGENGTTAPKIENCQPLKCPGEPLTNIEAINYNTSMERASFTKSPVAPPMKDAEMAAICEDADVYTGQDDVDLLVFNDLTCSYTPTLGDKMIPRFIQDDGLYKITNHFHGKEMTPNYENSGEYGIDVWDIKKGGDAYKRCDAGCDRGRLIKYTMYEGAWNGIMFLTPDTDVVKICLDPQDHTDDAKTPQCKPHRVITILLKSNLVIWPYLFRPSRIRFGSNERGQSPLKAYVIEFGYGVKDSKGTITSQFRVGNMYREFVVSESKGYPKEVGQRFALIFPNKGGLLRHFGFVIDNVEAASALVKPDEEVKKVSAKSKTGEKIGGDIAEKEIVPTTEKPLAQIDRSTTPPPIIFKLADSRIVEAVKAEDAQEVYTEGKWLLFGILMGFIIGTFLTVIMGGGAFWFMRRTVYSSWYRGMFKRYGCDASGTTGGITGIGFGNTATGMGTTANLSAISQVSSSSTADASTGKSENPPSVAM
ncbi:unnamed protein product [Caenorhabditis bovis]|uniref:Uncharacterized protein n=1 Tax=Caenorhabditis bovis TaxID=2654633 RepID=A0A8S1FDF1_9PELO|nr:unnamed protein product [Caenorhabditis bovis]